MNDVVYPHFGKARRESVIGDKGPGRAVATVESLLRNCLPLNPKKVATLQQSSSEFLAGLQKVSTVELHIEADVIDNTAILFYVAPPGDTPYVISLGDFLHLLTEGDFTEPPYKVEEILPFLEEIFQRIHIYLEALNFSPSDHLDHIEDEAWSLECLGERVFVSGDYFYSISTYDPEEEGITADPDMVLEGHPEARLIDLVAAYLEQTHGDSSKRYDGSTQVEIMRYSYKTHRTHVTRISYDKLEGACLTEILDNHPLLQHFDDTVEIIGAYLDRSLSREVNESQVLPFSK